MTAAERQVPLQIRVRPELLNRIDSYRLGMKLRPSRSQTIRFLLENAMAILVEHCAELRRPARPGDEGKR